MIFDLKTRYQERKELIEIIKNQGIKSQNVLDAMMMTPREIFAGEHNQENAYQNNAFPIGNGQTISQPYTVAYMTELLEVDNNCEVLEIGTGSGYQTYILSLLSKFVYTIERIDIFYKQTTALFNKLKVKNVEFLCGDGSLGWNNNKQFDRIIVTAGSFTIPNKLLEQLKVGGILVIPIGDRNKQKMAKIIKISNDKHRIDYTDNFTFVPLIGKDAWEK